MMVDQNLVFIVKACNEIYMPGEAYLRGLCFMAQEELKENIFDFPEGNKHNFYSHMLVDGLCDLLKKGYVTIDGERGYVLCLTKKGKKISKESLDDKYIRILNKMKEIREEINQNQLRRIYEEIRQSEMPLYIRISEYFKERKGANGG